MIVVCQAKRVPPKKDRKRIKIAFFIIFFITFVLQITTLIHMNSLKISLIAIFFPLLFIACAKDDAPNPPKFPDNGAYTGTVTVAPGTPNELVLNDIEVRFVVAPGETTADIEMLKVKFAAAMPLTIDMLVPGVGLTPTDTGYSIAGENIVPTYMKGIPYPDRTITGLTGTATAQTLSFSMLCGTYPLNFTGTRNNE
jgi:hypothetical protein